MSTADVRPSKKELKKAAKAAHRAACKAARPPAPPPPTKAHPTPVPSALLVHDTASATDSADTASAAVAAVAGERGVLLTPRLEREHVHAVYDAIPEQVRVSVRPSLRCCASLSSVCRYPHVAHVHCTLATARLANLQDTSLWYSGHRRATKHGRGWRPSCDGWDARRRKGTAPGQQC